jgi:hypothetical protein
MTVNQYEFTVKCAIPNYYEVSQVINLEIKTGSFVINGYETYNGNYTTPGDVKYTQTAPAGTGTPVWSLTDNAGGFNITSSGGVVTPPANKGVGDYSFTVNCTITGYYPQTFMMTS